MAHSPRVAGDEGGPDESVEIDRDAVVIRFRPTDPTAVLGWAEKEHRRTGRYRLSVFAAAASDGEAEEAVIERLLGVSELAGMDPKKNPKHWVCTAASELTALNFVFYKDDEEDEFDEHYSVDLGSAPTVDDAIRFLSPFVEGMKQ